ncbi:MAG TPA: radical SAM protein [Nanoarchaeota archaeon]|nr:radical SAM protein [Nanoarchaeota archaeon]
MAYMNLYWKVESGCNMGCVMCFRDHTRRIVRGYETKLLTEAKSAGFSAIILTGGEPTLRDDLPGLVRECSSYGFNVRLDTNGINLNREYLASLQEYLSILGLPLHGSTAQLHDSIARRQGHFEIVRNISSIATELGIPVKITTAVSRRNIGDAQNIAQYLADEIHPRIYGLNGVVKRSLGAKAYGDLEIAQAEFEELKERLGQGNYPFRLSFCSGRKDTERAYIFVNPDFTMSITSGDSEEVIGDLKTESLECILQRTVVDHERHMARSKATSL